MMEILISISAIVVSFFSLCFYMFQYCKETARGRKEATIHAFDELEETVFNRDDYQRITKVDNIAEIINDEINCQILSNYIALIEHFAVGINTKIYDIKTLRRLGRSYLIGQWELLYPFIVAKRNDREKNGRYDRNTLYDEFEKMIKGLG